MIRMALPLAAMAILGCTPKPAAEAPAPTPPQQEAGAMCNADAVADLVGQMKSEAVGADALQRSGAKLLRWIAPGQMVTMDFRGDRLNLHTDESGKIVRAACG